MLELASVLVALKYFGEMEFDSRACLRIQTNVVELGQSVGGEPDATAAIES